MGLGKTRQAIIALREAAPAGPFLIICPASVKLTWRREIGQIEPDASVAVISGSKWEDDHRWTVVNYDLLAKVENRLLARPWAGIVIDEAHAIKNDSQRTTRVLRLLGVGRGDEPASEPEVVYLLTGTPMANRPRDLFNLLRAVQHPLGSNFFTYAKRYCDAYDNGFGLDSRGASNLDELAGMIGGVLLRRTKDEALDLPPKVRTWHEIAVSSAKVGQLEARALAFYQANPATSGQTWTAFLGKLNQARHALAVAKAPATIELVRERLEGDEKVVVFTNFSAVVEKLKAAFGDEAVVLTGATSMTERQAAVDALQTDPKVRVLIGNLIAAGVGITLTAATHVLFNDLDWVPGNHWQAEDRIYRIGQTRPVFATYLCATGTLDDFIAVVLEQKARDIGVLEAHAAESASVLEEVLNAAASGERPQRPAPVYAPPSGRDSVGVLSDVLALLMQQRRGLSSLAPAQEEFTFPSSSRPGEVHTVSVVRGVARCTCEGFQYRANCKHVREVVNKLSAA